MFNLFATLGGIAFCAAPVILIIAIVNSIRKKNPKKWWKIFGATLLIFLVFELIAGAVECEHDYKLVDELAPTCTEQGYSKYHCDKCDRDKTDYVDELGHNMKITNRVEPTENLDGEIVSTCSHCGYEEVQTVEKLKKETEIVSSEGEISTSETPTKNISKMQQAFIDIGYTESESIRIEKVLSEVGITKCKVVAADEETTDGMRVVACSFNDPEVDGYFSTVHGEVSVVGSSEELWYDSEQGGVLSKIPDTYVSSNAEIILMQIAEDVAAQIAQNPSTVKFATLEWGFSREGLIYAVQGTFSCSNLMGVSEKHTLQVWCESSEDYAKIQPYKVVMDGAVLIDNTAN